jgi:hypothetical protein
MSWVRLGICKLAVRRDTPVYMSEIWRKIEKQIHLSIKYHGPKKMEKHWGYIMVTMLTMIKFGRTLLIE